MIYETIKKLREIFPGRHISIETSYDLYSNSKKIEVVWMLYIKGFNCKQFSTLTHLEVYVNQVLIQEMDPIKAAEKIANPKIDDLHQQRREAVRNHNWTMVNWIDEQIEKIGKK